MSIRKGRGRICEMEVGLILYSIKKPIKIISSNFDDYKLNWGDNCTYCILSSWTFSSRRYFMSFL